MNHNHEKESNRINIPSKRIIFNNGEALKFDADSCDSVSFATSAPNPLKLPIAEDEDEGRYIVATESGNQYIVGCGLIIDTNRQNTYLMPDEMTPPDITFGEPWRFGGDNLRTSPVTAVAQEATGLPYVGAEVNVDHKSPFEQANKLLEAEIKKREIKKKRLGGVALDTADRPHENVRQRFGLPAGFKTEKGSLYRYTNEGHSERWKFDGTHHKPMSIAVFVESTPDNLGVITRDGTNQSHLPLEKQAKSYILEKHEDKDAFRVIRDIRNVERPDDIYYGRINGESKVVQYIPASLTPREGSHVYEFGTTNDGTTVRHPGHKVVEILN